MWKLKPKNEQDPFCDEYTFDGDLLLSIGVQKTVGTAEVLQLIKELRDLVKVYIGLECLQVFEHSDGRVLWFLDLLKDRDKKHYDKEHNTVTCLLPSEY